MNIHTFNIPLIRILVDSDRDGSRGLGTGSGVGTGGAGTHVGTRDGTTHGTTHGSHGNYSTDYPGKLNYSNRKTLVDR